MVELAARAWMGMRRRDLRREVPVWTAQAEKDGTVRQRRCGCGDGLVHEAVVPVEELDGGVLRASGVRIAADKFRTRR